MASPLSPYSPSPSPSPYSPSPSPSPSAVASSAVGVDEPSSLPTRSNVVHLSIPLIGTLHFDRAAPQNQVSAMFAQIFVYLVAALVVLVPLGRVVQRRVANRLRTPVVGALALAYLHAWLHVAETREYVVLCALLRAQVYAGWLAFVLMSVRSLLVRPRRFEPLAAASSVASAVISTTRRSGASADVDDARRRQQ